MSIFRKREKSLREEYLASINRQKGYKEEIAELLRLRHKIGKKQEDDFQVRNLTQMMEIMKSAVKTMSLLLGSIASVSLLVGGIGIMNIMLVSVTERTKEIGIRMAIGAKSSDIQIQFLKRQPTEWKDGVKPKT